MSKECAQGNNKLLMNEPISDASIKRRMVDRVCQECLMGPQGPTNGRHQTWALGRSTFSWDMHRLSALFFTVNNILLSFIYYNNCLQTIINERRNRMCVNDREEGSHLSAHRFQEKKSLLV